MLTDIQCHPDGQTVMQGPCKAPLHTSPEQLTSPSVLLECLEDLVTPFVTRVLYSLSSSKRHSSMQVRKPENMN